MSRKESKPKNNRPTLEDRLNFKDPWLLIPPHFDGFIEIWDFEAHHYVNFLNSTRSIDDLVTGLTQLSPLADDALDLAEKMSDSDFEQFKAELSAERSQAKNLSETTNTQLRFGALMLPSQFLPAQLLAPQFEATLGTALIRIMPLDRY